MSEYILQLLFNYSLWNFSTQFPSSLEKHQKSCTKSNPMSRSTKDKNFLARASTEKSFENTSVTSSKNKNVVHEKDENADNIEPRSSHPTYVSMKKISNADQSLIQRKLSHRQTSQFVFLSGIFLVHPLMI